MKSWILQKFTKKEPNENESKKNGKNSVKTTRKWSFDLENDNHEYIIKTDQDEYIEIKIVSEPRNQYKIFFNKENEIPEKKPMIHFEIQKKTRVYIASVDTFEEKGMGWCGFMIQTLINLLKKWENNGQNFTEIFLLNDSYRISGNNNPAGTICYLKYISKHFPYFSHGSNYNSEKSEIYDLGKYRDVSNTKIWLNKIIPKLGIHIQEGDYYYFYKNNPIKTSEPTKKTRKRRSKKYSRT